MNTDRQYKSSPHWGSVEVEPISDRVPTLNPPDGSPTPGSWFRYTWRPPHGIEGELPQGFSLTFDCLTGPDGVRRFAPEGGIHSFIIKAALGGEAVRTGLIEPSPEQRFSDRAMRLFYQMSPGFREHLDRTFTRESDFYVPRGGHILPAELGLDAAGRGEPWTPRGLIARGRAEAVTPENVDNATGIRLGLTAAARLRPLDPKTLSKAQARALVRLALFDLGPADAPLPKRAIDTVQERLFTTLEDHIDDDTEHFERWFFVNINNIVHLIGKQRKNGGTMPRAVVRQALLELVFRSFTSVGNCIHIQMTAFARALPEPLSELERAHFESLYQNQSYLGGFPLVLLHDRFDFLREAILDVLADPSDVLRVGVVLRLLDYYGTMVCHRREADRQYKAQPRNEQNRVVQVLPFDPDRDFGVAPARNTFQEIAGALRESRQASCLCVTNGHWEANLVSTHDLADPVVIEDTCGECGHSEPVEISRKEYTEVGWRILTGEVPSEN